MVNIRELPIEGSMRDLFEKFTDHVGGNLGVMEYKIIERQTLNPDDMMYPDVMPICAICGHGLIYKVVYHDGKNDKNIALGVVCAANLEALKRKDLDTINYERTVKLEHKTLIKRLMEYIAKENKLTLEVQHFDKIQYITTIYNTLQEEYDEFYFNNFIYRQGPQAEQEAFKKHLEFCISLYQQYTRGKVFSDKQLNALDYQMKIPVEQRFKNFKDDLETLRAEYHLKRKYSMHETLARQVSEKWGVSQRDRDFMKDLMDYYYKNGRYSDKQMAAIRTVYKKYYKVPDLWDLEEED